MNPKTTFKQTKNLGLGSINQKIMLKSQINALKLYTNSEVYQLSKVSSSIKKKTTFDFYSKLGCSTTKNELSKIS
jgi:hypothetical protein